VERLANNRNSIRNNKNIIKIILLAVLTAVIMFIVGSIMGMVTSPLYTGAIWKDMTGSWLIMMVFYDLFVGFLFVLIYSIILKGLPGKGLSRGLFYGFLFALIGVVPGLIMTYLSMAVPAILIFWWAVSGFVQYIASGMVVGALY